MSVYLPRGLHRRQPEGACCPTRHAKGGFFGIAAERHRVPQLAAILYHAQLPYGDAPLFQACLDGAADARPGLSCHYFDGGAFGGGPEAVACRQGYVIVRFQRLEYVARQCPAILMAYREAELAQEGGGGLLVWQVA